MLRKVLFSWIVKEFLIPAIRLAVTTFPLLLLGQMKYSEKLNNIFPGVITYYESNTGQVLFILLNFLILFHVLIPAAFARYEKSPIDEVKLKTLTNTLAKLDNVVTRKAHNATQEIQKVKSALTTETVINIQKPDDQIYILGNELHSIVEEYYSERDVQLIVYETGEQGLSVFSHWPLTRSPSISDEVLKHSNFTPNYAFRKQQAVTILDIKKESNKKNSNRYFSEDETDVGCLYCFPINSGIAKQDGLIVELRADRANLFKGESFDIMKVVCKIFANRLFLEHTYHRVKLGVS